MLLLVSSPMQADGATSDSYRRPNALLAMEEARRSMIRSGRIEWTVLPEGREDDALFFVSRFARSGDMIFENRGDRDGWTIFDRSEGVKKGIHKYPQIYMTSADGQWHFQETSPTADWWRNPGQPSPFAHHIKDIRHAGLGLTSECMDAGVGMQAILNDRNHKITRWEAAQRGDLHEVTAHTDTGGRIRWFINAAKGWNAERTEFEVDGIQQEAVCSLKEYDGVWLPETTDYFLNGELQESVRIRTAALNRPSDKDRFTPTDMGAEEGTAIYCQRELGKPVEHLYWNGNEICSLEKWYKDLAEGKHTWGPMLHRRFRSGERYTSPYETEEQRKEAELFVRQTRLRKALSRDGDLWSRYVREFIEKYALDDAQKAQAQKILDMCQKRANEILSRNRAELLNVVNELQSAKEGGNADQVKKLEDRVAELRAPIREIFEDELKPRLEQIPTRAQRKAATKSADDGSKAGKP